MMYASLIDLIVNRNLLGTKSLSILITLHCYCLNSATMLFLMPAIKCQVSRPYENGYSVPREQFAFLRTGIIICRLILYISIIRT